MCLFVISRFAWNTDSAARNDQIFSCKATTGTESWKMTHWQPITIQIQEWFSGSETSAPCGRKAFSGLAKGWDGSFGSWQATSGALFLKQMCPCASCLWQNTSWIHLWARPAVSRWVGPGSLFLIALSFIWEENKEWLISQFPLTSFHFFTSLQSMWYFWKKTAEGSSGVNIGESSV